jgi:hypothetical protein
MSYRCRTGARIEYEPATTHDEMSACVKAPATVSRHSPRAGANPHVRDVSRDGVGREQLLRRVE